MTRILRLSFFCVAGIVACLVNEALPRVQEDQQLQRKSDAAAQTNLKLRLLASLPVGIKITHSPNPARASVGGRSGFKFIWPYATSVRAMIGSVRIEEFGAFAWENGRWVFSNFTGRPYTATDFSDWYSCPNATLTPGRLCSDAHNWSGRRTLERGKTRWYFIGVDSKGKRVKGEAVIQHLPEVNGQLTK